MKKTTLTLATGIMVASLLTGCGQTTEQKLQSNADSLLKSLQTFDMETLSEYVNEKEESTETDTSEAEATTESSENDEMMQSLEGYFTDCAKEMTYEVKNVDADKLTVDVACTYVDSKTMVETLYTDLITAAFAHLDGSEITDEEMTSIIDKAISSSDTKNTKTVEYTLQYEDKDGNYELKEIPDELLDTATAGVYGYMNAISDSYSEEEEEQQNYSDAAEQLTYTAENCDDGTVLTVSNPTELDLDISAEIVFNDKDGKMVSESSGEIYYSKAGSSKIICSYVDDGVQFESVDVQFTTSKPYSKDGSDNLKLTDSKSEDGIIVKVTNENDFTINSATVHAVYYKDGKCIGFAEDYADTLEQGKYAALTLSPPYDSDYNNIEYDDYKLFVDGYSYE